MIVILFLLWDDDRREILVAGTWPTAPAAEPEPEPDVGITKTSIKDAAKVIEEIGE